MLIGIPFLLSWASFDTKLEYHQHHLYFFIYMVHPILFGCCQKIKICENAQNGIKSKFGQIFR
jgi:hypothetical protein